jgi:hypothetical protein
MVTEEEIVFNVVDRSLSPSSVAAGSVEQIARQAIWFGERYRDLEDLIRELESVSVESLGFDDSQDDEDGCLSCS